MTVTILAKETASIPSENPYHPDSVVKHYDIPIVPRVPLRVGQRVRIWSLVPRAASPSHEPAATAADEYNPPTYTTQDSGVVGTVVRVRSTNSAATEFVVQNENAASSTVFACVAIQHIQGQTVHLSIWERLIRAVYPPPGPERCIPLELDAKVLWSTEAWKQTLGQRTANAEGRRGVRPVAWDELERMGEGSVARGEDGEDNEGNESD